MTNFTVKLCLFFKNSTNIMVAQTGTSQQGNMQNVYLNKWKSKEGQLLLTLSGISRHTSIEGSYTGISICFYSHICVKPRTVTPGI